MSNRIRSQLLMSTLLAGVVSIAAPAVAQTEASAPGIAPADAAPADNGGEILVTGSLIRNPNLTSAVPVTAINDKEITLRATNTAEELLRGIPGVSPSIGSQVNNGANGINSVDLRGLGPNRNIVLLDSNRIVPTLANGAVDLNVIPVALVQRVEVLTGGASTTYGADAVSGVVNFITRKNFSGVDLRATYKLPTYGDGRSYRTDLTIGGNFADDKGNAVLSIGYTDVDPIYQTRGFANFGISPTTGRASGSSAASVPTGIDFGGAVGLQQVNPSSTALVPQYAGFNFNPYNIFQTPLQRKSVYAATNYEVADGLEVYSRALYNQATIRTIIAPSGIFGQSLTIPGNNPYLPAGIRDQICTFNGIALGTACNTNPALALPTVYRRSVEVGPRLESFKNDVLDVRAGVRGNITSSLKFDVAASYGRSEQTDTRSGYVLLSRVQQALNATSTTACTVTTNNCVPLNLFGPAGSISADQVGFLQGTSTTKIVTKLKQVHGLVNGDFGVKLPGANNPINFAVGAEHREYEYTRSPDALAQNPSELGGAGGAVTAFSGGYKVTEGFGELIVPIMDNQKFFEELSLEGGIRRSHYEVTAANSPKFDTTTYKAGATWSPVSGIRFRGNFQRAVRAPNINELFNPVSTGLTSLTVDPCAGSAPTTNANLAAICRAQGAPASSIGFIQNPNSNQPNQTSGGNLNIKPEKANTLTLGVVLTPAQFIPGFSLSVDYYNIDVKDAITNATPGDVIAACFGNITAASATSAACTSIRRSTSNGRLSGPAATIPGLPLPLTNNGRAKTDGIDLTANYTHQFEGLFGLNLNFVGNYTRKLTFQASPTSVARNCVGYYSANCGFVAGQLQPKFSWQQRTTLTRGAASLSLLWRHLDKMRYEGSASDYLARGFTDANRTLFSGVVTNAAGANSALAGQSFNFNKIKAYDYFDLSAQVDVTTHLQLTFVVTNLFNKTPPIVGSPGTGTTTANSGNTFPSTYDPIGRTYGMTARVTF